MTLQEIFLSDCFLKCIAWNKNLKISNGGVYGTTRVLLVLFSYVFVFTSVTLFMEIAKPRRYLCNSFI